MRAPLSVSPVSDRGGAAPCRFLPFGFGRQAYALGRTDLATGLPLHRQPLAIRDCVAPRHVPHRVIVRIVHGALITRVVCGRNEALPLAYRHWILTDAISRQVNLMLRLVAGIDRYFLLVTIQNFTRRNFDQLFQIARIADDAQGAAAPPDQQAAANRVPASPSTNNGCAPLSPGGAAQSSSVDCFRSALVRPLAGSWRASLV